MELTRKSQEDNGIQHPRRSVDVFTILSNRKRLGLFQHPLLQLLSLDAHREPNLHVNHQQGAGFISE
jgi:hypothetical protein